MKKNPNPDAKQFLRVLRATEGLRELPVVVAARMSMAFPFFFSASRCTRSIARGIRRTQTATEVLETLSPEKVWFADGGICSNLPVHFFDRALPRWPTFALDLRSFHRDLQPTTNTPERDKVWIDHEFRDGAGHSVITEWWTELKGERRLRVHASNASSASVPRSNARSTSSAWCSTR